MTKSCELTLYLPYTHHRRPLNQCVHHRQVKPAYPIPFSYADLVSWEKPCHFDQHKSAYPIQPFPHRVGDSASVSFSSTKSRFATLYPHTHSPTKPRLAERTLGKSRRRTAYPQQIVTTRLLYCLQDRFAQLSRLQRI